MTSVIPNPGSTTLGEDADLFQYLEGDLVEISEDADFEVNPEAHDDHIGADSTRGKFDHLSDIVERALATSNPDQYITTVRDRMQNDRNALRRERRIRDEKTSKLRRTRTAAIIVAEHRATGRARNGLEGNQPWQVYTGNALRRLTPDGLLNETRRNARRKARKS